MKVLIVTAHPVAESFTLARARRFADGLAAAGHEAEIANLYEEGFDPAVSAEELKKWQEGEVAPEVAAYQARIREADGLVLVYPVWWGTPPAVLAGWLHRVLSRGFAFRHVNGRTEGQLRKRAQVLVNVGSQKREDVDLESLYVEPMHSALRYSGMEVLPAQTCWGVYAKADPAQLRPCLDATYELGLKFFA